MENLDQNNITVIKQASKPPYLLGLLGLIPLVGFFVGLGLALLGIFKYKDKILIFVGVACMIFTVAVYSSLYYIGFKSDFGKKGWEQHAQMQLNSLVKDIEFYKLEHGTYPDSLTQLKNKNRIVFIIDPTQSAQKRKNVYYNYKNLGDKYLIFSSGTDGIPNTNDDIFPQIKNKNGKIGWVRNE
ncbi:MAG TPA: type II secretion system protein GspG [Bacteroidales bacterium]